MNEKLYDKGLKITVLDKKDGIVRGRIELVTVLGNTYSSGYYSEDIFTILVQQKPGDKIAEIKIPEDRKELLPAELLAAA